jgi:SOS-response transcriptional repressor LexA
MATAKADRSALTAQQMAVYGYIFEKARTTGIQPSYQEVCREFGFSSPNSVLTHTKAIARKGWISLPRNGESRSVRFLKIPHSGAPFKGFILPEPEE